MNDELYGQELLDFIQTHISDHTNTSPDQPHKLIDSIRASIADHPDNSNAQAAAALASVVAYGSVIYLEDFESMLHQLREIEGLNDIKDVCYSDTGLINNETIQLSHKIPRKDIETLNNEEHQLIDTFIKASFESNNRHPSSD